MNTKSTPKAPNSAQVSNEQLGKVNAAGVANVGGILFGTLVSPKPRVNPVNPALHPDDPADGTAIQGMRDRGGGGSI